MKNAALFLGVLIILGGVGWFLFNSAQTAEAPTHTDLMQKVDGTPPASPTDDLAPTPPVDTPTGEVSSFADCVAAGNPVMESYPRQCRHGDQHFVEDVSLPEEPIACTADAKICPDGSAVGRTGPNCEFAQCPEEENPTTVVCSPESKQAEACTMQYDPVCGLRQVQCVTSPCPPIPETFSNGCAACAEPGVISYTPGSCSGGDGLQVE